MSTGTNQGESARYEFRIFGDDALAAGERIAQMATAQGQEQSANTYILITDVEQQNCKIRDGYVEVKTLVAEDAGLEQWQPTIEKPFPVDATWLREKLFPALQQDPSTLLRKNYSVRQLLDEVIAPYPTLYPLLVLKQRHFFRQQECRLEVTTVHITGKLPVHTVAVEGTEVEQVQKIRTELGLQNYANTNYVQMLKAFL